MSGFAKAFHFFLMLFLTLLAIGGILVIWAAFRQMIIETLKYKKEYEELKKHNERAEKIRKNIENTNENMKI